MGFRLLIAEDTAPCPAVTCWLFGRFHDRLKVTATAIFTHCIEFAYTSLYLYLLSVLVVLYLTATSCIKTANVLSMFRYSTMVLPNIPSNSR